MVAEVETLKAATKTVLRDIAKHANGLAVGLQNAAPPQEKGPPKSVQYLTAIAAELESVCRTIDGVPPANVSDEL
jgi:hypothetical protein